MRQRPKADVNSSSENVSEILNREEIEHLSAQFSQTRDISLEDDYSLPYHELGGPGLERLCYLLLCSQGKVPRYFGKPGQKQYGIDLIVVCGEECVVYQCKNVKDFSMSRMRDALKLFEDEWLGRPDLSKPNQFILCCSLPLHDLKQNKEWLELESEFRGKTGVSLEFWDRNYLDETLRKLPDVVADLFSNRAAEQFCDLDDWNSDLFRPIVEDSGDIQIERYLDLKKGSNLYIDPTVIEHFEEKLGSNGVLLVRGLPGTGKTITTLALAESLHQRRYRIFYLSLRHHITEDMLVDGIRRRLSRPTIFLVDDCEGDFEIPDLVRRRMLREMRGRGFLIFIARTTPTPEGMPREDYSDFESELAGDGAILEFHTTPSLFRQIIKTAKPQLARLSTERLNKIFEFTGHDLFLLDQLLEIINSPDEIDQLEPGVFFEATLERYFRVSTTYYPCFMKLAAIAQFDIAPPVTAFEDGLDLHGENERATAQFVVMADIRPPRYFFLHSSAAELIFRSLASRVTDEYTELAADYLIEFFKSYRMNDDSLAVELSKVIGNHLKLVGDQDEENRLMGQFLGDDDIFSLIERTFEQLDLNLLGICLVILGNADQATLARYRGLVEQKIDDGTVLHMAATRPWGSGFFLSILKYHADLLSSLREQLASRGIGWLIETADFQNILLILAYLPEPHDSKWVSLLQSIPGSEFEEMIQRTISSGRTIGTMNLSLRDLEKSGLLEELEGKVGSDRYLRLITSLGTIMDLIRIIQYSSPAMGKELIGKLDSEILDSLIDNTISSGRSIGTMPLYLRDLGKSGLLEEL